MHRLKRLFTGGALVMSAAAMANAGTIGYLSNVVGPTPTEAAYSLVLPQFNASLGTLTGVTLYFFANETSSTFSVKNVSAGSITANMTAAVDLVSGSANSLVAADKFSGETVTIFDTGIGTALGSCGAGKTPAPGTCASITVGAGATKTYGPISVNNTDANFGLTTGTGVQGLTGVKKTGTSIASYVGAGTFTLSGTTLNTSGFSGTGGNFTLSQVATGQFKAEVDYTFTPAVATPEPGSMLLVSSALIGLGLLRKRAVK